MSKIKCGLPVSGQFYSPVCHYLFARLLVVKREKAK